MDHVGTSCYNISLRCPTNENMNPVDARKWIRFWGEGAWINSGIISPYNTPRHPRLRHPPVVPIVRIGVSLETLKSQNSPQEMVSGVQTPTE